MLIRLIKIDVFRKMPKFQGRNIPIFWIVAVLVVIGVAYTINNDSTLRGETFDEDELIFDEDFGNLNSNDQGITHFDDIDEVAHVDEPALFDVDDVRSLPEFDRLALEPPTVGIPIRSDSLGRFSHPLRDPERNLRAPRLANEVDVLARIVDHASDILVATEAVAEFDRLLECATGGIRLVVRGPVGFVIFAV